MQNVLNSWLNKYFSDPDGLILLLSVFFFWAVLTTMGNMLAPALVALVLAYLLDRAVHGLDRCKVPHSLSVWIVFLLFLGLSLVGIVGILPVLIKQAHNFIHELPQMLDKGQKLLMQLPERYPDYVSIDQIGQVMAGFQKHGTQLGKWFLQHALSTIPNAIIVMVYAILVPMLVFFFLKDKGPIIRWLSRFTPKHKRAVYQVGSEMNVQIGNYVRGKIIEIFIVSVVSCIVFFAMDLRYAMLLGILVGLSTIIPYIGAVVVTIPVMLVAILQWGWTAPFAYITIAYTIILTLDANILVPLLFSEAVSLHPVAIILAVLVFGGLWGFWGVFFAIPLASLVKAIINAWPTQTHTGHP